ncbi:SWR1-complex protein 4 [Wickerhamiella sorbophila]|uniref:SWR1-complex protein 4 n=1 Tax=Wickerhamiella sorbophila TaxID=45607 RepID=A0A2T0FI98_9ASCO|nr:SWR1-complex protein 4 [Wickerhamiella sorbophila]PRT54677.1 SWR1-complex protein 4 [Wickerhamiella sorbophila]
MSLPAVKKLKTEVRRPDGMQRELYSLLGENTPPVMVVPDHYKGKPNWRQKATPWNWCPFTNRARDDSLVLKHWVRGQPDTDEIYRFAKFNVKINVPEWSDEDYQLFKRDEWTIEETRYLFDLCREFDLRWLVIHDRYDYQSVLDRRSSVDSSVEAGAEKSDAPDDQIQNVSQLRTIEDLKSRYYEVCSALLRKSSYLSPNDEELLEQMNFSKENEVKRKAHLERLMSRSPNQVAEEEALVLECRRLEALADQMAHERAEIISLLDTPAATGSIAQYQSSQGVTSLHQQLLAEKSRKPKEHVNIVNAQSGPAFKKGHVDEAKSGLAAQIIQKRLSTKEEAAYGITYHEKFAPGVYLRSAKLTTLKQNQASRAQSVFNELSIPMRPIMPTAKVAAKFDTLLQSISLLLDAKRALDKIEAELRVSKEVKANSGS